MRWPKLFDRFSPFMLQACVALLLAHPSCAFAQQANDPDAAVSEEVVEAKKIRPIIDLGDFHVKDLRPSRNETLEVTFAMKIAFSPSVNKATVEALEKWKHRLRDQVIVAIRTAARTDFLEPGLNRFRRIVHLRVQRLLDARIVSDVLLTEFIFATN
jgi:flagellar basal body-associated protein FliL